jgi:dimethylargininase
MLIAFTRPVPPSITACELTHLPREPIDVALASRQHDGYEAALEALGCEVRRIPAEPGLPDSVFVEDTAVVLDEIAVAARPGAPSRRGEVPGVVAALREFRDVLPIDAPGTLEGGDVLRIGSRIYVGRSERTNEEGIRQFRAHVEPLGYAVREVPVSGCLHLKTAVTQVGDRLVLLNPSWVPIDAFSDLERIDVDPAEPFAGNALRIGSSVLFPSELPRTARRLEKRGIELHRVDAGELAKAEGGLTCGSILVSA